MKGIWLSLNLISFKQKAASLKEGHKLLVAKSNQESPYSGLQWINKYSYIGKYHWHQVFDESVTNIIFSNAYQKLRIQRIWFQR